jgi:hypothetical protein
VEEECGYIPMVLVQNKIDLIQEAQIHMYVHVYLSISELCTCAKVAGVVIFKGKN